MLNKKNKLKELFGKYPNLSYEEAKTEISELKNQYFRNCKHEYFKGTRVLKKTKKRGKRVESSANPTDRSKASAEAISTPSSTFSEEWFDMEDSELIRHVCRMVILDSNSTYKDKLDASAKLMSLKEKTGTLDVKTKSEIEVVNKFKSQPTQALVRLLKESSPSEPLTDNS